ncbi:MAG: RNA polymerase sigma factor [Tannerellaceae bacterium]|jgi:RNA polymerase sigma-70 factor (ECF subfamily)|nr:RNA polymerase sigma factor [Tannerellaceae bacterium]
MEQEQFIREIVPLRESLLVYAGRLMQGGEEDAEDVVQEVLLKLWDMRRELLRYENIRGLAFRITKHLCINRLKVRERYEEAPKEWITTGEVASPYRLLEQKDQVEHLGQIIDRLPALQQAVLKMKHIDGLEVEEITRITGCTAEAIRANLSRARKKVKELFFSLDTL